MPVIRIPMNKRPVYINMPASLLALICSAMVVLCTHAPAQATAVAANNQPIAESSERDRYQQAIKALEKGDLVTFNTLRNSLAGYPLQPYLDYFGLRKQLKKLPYADVETFLSENKKNYLADRLRRDWLRQLAKQKRWHEFTSYYRASVADTALKCQYLWARQQIGDTAALTEVAELWNVPKSQPNACDPLFTLWKNHGYLTDDLAWQRYHRALLNRRYSLARYLKSSLPESMRDDGKLLWSLYRKPQTIEQYQKFHLASAQMHDIILYGVNRLARRDAKSAQKVWTHYDSQRLFSDNDRRNTQAAIANALARQGYQSEALSFARSNRISINRVIEQQIHDALAAQDWQQVYTLLGQLDNEAQHENRWQYWRARALEQLGITDPLKPAPAQIYAELAKKRDFYGFLASDILGSQYSLVDTPVKPVPELMDAVADVPGIIRARELYMLGELYYARQEWYRAACEFDDPAILAAGKLAQTWGWYRKSIEAMIDAKYWDDLELRFPLAYPDAVAHASQNTQIPVTLLYAITRQESAFAHDARSPVGAMGLMQLMPATAKDTARRSGLRYSRHDLLTPDKNINLGSRYLEQLLDQFNGNRILAAAAYNAGPTRVKQWLRKNNSNLPYDVWIEIIPYKETRHYVQNVLAYSVIYSYRLGEQTRLVNVHETKIN